MADEDAGQEMEVVYSGPAGEAGRVKDRLQQAGIAAVLSGGQTVPTDQGAGPPTTGGVTTAQVMVPQDRYEEARRMVENW